VGTVERKFADVRPAASIKESIFEPPAKEGRRFTDFTRRSATRARLTLLRTKE